ncbi:MAG: PF20097 family protein [Candidatus Aegiribacteria sp.]|nr:PF20097 family protein [Candidatus Aegiribacteria sp.]
MSVSMNIDEFIDIKCPKCGRDMSHGYITGKGMLWWSQKEKTKTRFRAKWLRREVDWWNAPTLEAVRCEECKIGIFRYDY